MRGDIDTKADQLETLIYAAKARSGALADAAFALMGAMGLDGLSPTPFLNAVLYLYARDVASYGYDEKAAVEAMRQAFRLQAEETRKRLARP